MALLFISGTGCSNMARLRSGRHGYLHVILGPPSAASRRLSIIPVVVSPLHGINLQRKHPRVLPRPANSPGHAPNARDAARPPPLPERQCLRTQESTRQTLTPIRSDSSSRRPHSRALTRPARSLPSSRSTTSPVRSHPVASTITSASSLLPSASSIPRS